MTLGKRSKAGFVPGTRTEVDTALTLRSRSLSLRDSGDQTASKFKAFTWISSLTPVCTFLNGRDCCIYSIRELRWRGSRVPWSGEGQSRQQNSDQDPRIAASVQPPSGCCLCVELELGHLCAIHFQLIYDLSCGLAVFQLCAWLWRTYSYLMWPCLVSFPCRQVRWARLLSGCLPFLLLSCFKSYRVCNRL